MVPGSITQIPFMQEVFVFTWRLMTTNQVSRRLTLCSMYSKTSRKETTSTKKS